MNTHFVAYIGIDWADRKHDICLYDPGSQTQEYSVIGAQPQGSVPDRVFYPATFRRTSLIGFIASSNDMAMHQLRSA